MGQRSLFLTSASAAGALAFTVAVAGGCSSSTSTSAPEPTSSDAGGDAGAAEGAADAADACPLSVQNVCAGGGFSDAFPNDECTATRAVTVVTTTADAAAAVSSSIPGLACGLVGCGLYECTASTLTLTSLCSPGAESDALSSSGRSTLQDLATRPGIACVTVRKT